MAVTEHNFIISQLTNITGTVRKDKKEKKRAALAQHLIGAKGRGTCDVLQMLCPDLETADLKEF
jgi:hypothetical protein